MSFELIILLSLLPVEGGLYLLYAFHNRRYMLMLNTETSKITTLKKGFCEIKGQVKFLEEKLMSPLSKVPCVYYHFKVEQEQSSGKSQSWRTIINDTRYTEFAVQDSSGQAIIRLEGAKLKMSTDARGRTGIFTETPEELKQALSQYNVSDKVWFFKKNFRYTEKYLEEGDALYVLGEVLDFNSYYPIIGKGKLPYIVSDKSEEQLVKQSRQISRIMLSILIVLPLAVAVFLLFRNSWF